MAALLLSDVSLGVVARTAPQMNIFIVGMPLKILLGNAFNGLLFSLSGDDAGWPLSPSI